MIPFVNSSKLFMSCLLMAPSRGAKARKDVRKRHPPTVSLNMGLGMGMSAMKM